MIPPHLAAVTEELPYRLREELESYVKAIDTVAPRIARECHVKLTDAIRSDFLFIIGIGRLWSVINGSHWLAVDSVGLFQRTEASVVRAGSLSLGPGEGFNRELQALRANLESLLKEHDLFEPVTMGHVRDVMTWVAGRV